ncbi:hypothetical protein [Marinoscillum sp.]|uniref:hypothetical protein n=1 Tax=Marinoscillum sp. TaxID=2024838 RepID=UPI003BAC8B35
MKKLTIITVFSILTLCFSCSEEIDPLENLEEIEKVDLEDESKLSRTLLGKGTTSSGRINESNFGGLDFDKIYKRKADENSEYSNYMIRLYPPKEVKNSVEYLVLIELKEGFRTYILQYQTEDKFLNKIYDPTIYTGYVNILDLNRELLAQNYFVDGEDVPLEDASNGRVAAQKCDCEYEYTLIQPGTTYGEGGGYLVPIGLVCTCAEVAEISDQGVEDSGGGGIGEVIYDPSNPDGSGGGGSGNENPEDGITRDRVGTVKDIDCDVENHIFYNNECVPLEEYLADKWEPCLMEIWNAATESDAAFAMLAGFLEEYPMAELKIDVVNSDMEIYEEFGGDKVYEWGDLLDTYGFSIDWFQEQYVYLTMHNMTNASQIFIGSVLGHELIHASMMEDIYSNTNIITNNQYDLSDLQNNFPLIYDLWITQGLGPEGASHEAMAQNYRDGMIMFMREIDISLNGSPVNEGIYEELSWVGLEGTDAFEAAVATGQISVSQLNNIQNAELSKGKCN